MTFGHGSIYAHGNVGERDSTFQLEGKCVKEVSKRGGGTVNI